ncbi:hypothetical protein PsYK624_154310 [Phanerochaete sordida]|uniref:Uncharacterized protein n=1 Tax=Phanerochaete sordida TaxID=48140 RepID=A0A9P3GNU6_9APHY|nr:hypothetical protein PsYK624_154310 [Phanerochaete sordida]
MRETHGRKDPTRAPTNLPAGPRASKAVAARADGRSRRHEASALTHSQRYAGCMTKPAGDKADPGPNEYLHAGRRESKAVAARADKQSRTHEASVTI